MKKKVNIKNDGKVKKNVVLFIEFLVIFLILGSSIALAANGSLVQNQATKPVLAPENPEFIIYHSNKMLAQPEATLNAHKTGLLPAPVDLNYLSQTSTVDINTPAYYDLRVHNKVTSVKDQGSAGVCWAFATYGSLESYLLPGENRDFSENNMKNLLSSAYPEGFDRSSNDGGNAFMSTAYLARWSGPIEEKADPYSITNGVSPQNLNIQKHVQDVLFFPDRKDSLDNEEIKSAILKYGALYTSMYIDSAYYSSNNSSYYFNGSSIPNHAVDIVGWNDNFDRNNFSNVPPGDGAFIVKNSWGTGWGDNGYTYISYYDSKIGKDNAVFIAETTDNYDHIYQYDPLGWVMSVGYGYPTAWLANTFTAKSAETLKAVSFYTTDSTCNYEVYIYTSPESGPISQKGPLVSKSGKISAAGYHTVPLDSEVQLKAGQNFSVVLKLTTPNYNYPIAIEMPYAGLSSKAKANSGESFVSSDGSTWDDMTTHFSNTNVCIKAFTVSGNTLPIANFSSNVTSGNAPLSVQFMDLSKNAKSLNWDFGDGTRSTEQNPLHTYSMTGTYTVNLTAINTKGTDSKLAAINVLAKPVPPVADFNSNVTSGNVPLSVQFMDLSKNATSWNWNFGDGATSDQQQPVHTYSTAGIYIVNLTASNTYGTDSKLATITVTAKPALPDAAFTSSLTTGKAPLAVQFTDLSKGSPAKWYWDFGDKGTSTDQNPTHTYSKAGIYTVKLIVTNNLGSNKVIKPKYIVVTTAQKKPTASFSSNVTTGNAPLRVAFSNASTGSPTSWKWTFGDGGTSKEMNPIHTYTRAGKYTVSLTVSNAAGSSTVINPGYIVVNFLKRPRW